MKFKICSLLVILTLAFTACAPDPTATPTLEPPPAATQPPAPTQLPTAAATEAPAGAPPSAAVPSAPPAAGTNAAHGQFVYAPGDGSIWIQDAASGQARALIKSNASAFADAPAFSPDGQSVVYTLSVLSAQGAAQNTLHVIGADGNNDRLAVQPPDVATELTSPVFSPDGKWIYYTASYPVPPSQEHFEIRRTPAGGGAAQTVLTNAQTPVLSADGKRLAFLRFNFQTFAASLWIANINGQNPKQLLADNVFSIIATPRFSPDGEWILFSASGPPSHALPGAACQPRVFCEFAQPVYADGLPWDLWLVSVDGAHFQQLTKMGADSPYPAWSRDGRSVVFFATGGIFSVDVNTRAVSQISNNGGHGVFDWWAEP